MFRFLTCLLATFMYAVILMSMIPTTGYHQAASLNGFFAGFFLMFAWPLWAFIAEIADLLIAGRRNDWLIAMPVMTAIYLAIILCWRLSMGGAHLLAPALGAFFGVYALRRAVRHLLVT